MSPVLEDNTILSAQKVFSGISHVTFLFNEQMKKGECYTITFIYSCINTVPDFARIQQMYRN